MLYYLTEFRQIVYVVKLPGYILIGFLQVGYTERNKEWKC